MINISTTTPVSWPTPPSVAVAPVAAAPAVKPVQSGGPESQAERETRRERVKVDEESSPAASPSSKAGAPEPQASAQARRDAAVQRSEQANQKAEADKASHRKAMDRLQEVLTNMWAASAAVIDQALGLEPKAEALPGNQSDTAPDLSAVAASTISRRLPPSQTPAGQTTEAPDQPVAEGMPWPVMPRAADETPAADLPDVPGGEVIAYDENGNSSLAPLEAGTLLSERV